MFSLAKPYAQDLRERRARAGRAGQSRHAAGAQLWCQRELWDQAHAAV